MSFNLASDKSWNVTTNGAQVPVAIEVYATGKFGHFFAREVMQRYDFYDFYRDIRPDPDELVVGPVSWRAGGNRNTRDGHTACSVLSFLFGFLLTYPRGGTRSLESAT